MNSRLSNIKYLMVDVDGTMTDSGIYYDDQGNELKRFSTRDGEGIKAAKKAGIKIVVVTGRSCNATKRRMEELQIDFFAQGISDKYHFLSDYLKENKITPSEFAYIGDDINDLPAMKLSGYVGCPADACKEVKNVADYISLVKGGQGAVRDCIEHLLEQRGDWEKAIGQNSC